MQIQLTRIQNRTYYMAYDLIRNNIGSAFFRSCVQNARRCIRKHNIPKTEYVYATKRNDRFVVHASTYKGANLYISSDYVERHIVNFTPAKADNKRRFNEKKLEDVSKCVHAFPCIYLFSLGPLNDVRTSLGISEGDQNCEQSNQVYKFGMTNNLQRRTSEHMRTYGHLPNVNMELQMCAYIDPINLHDAERKLKEYVALCNMLVMHDTYKELILASSSDLKTLRKMYEDIGNVYNICNVDLYDKIKSLEYENKYLRMEMDLHRSNHENEILRQKLKTYESTDDEDKCV